MQALVDKMGVSDVKACPHPPIEVSAIHRAWNWLHDEPHELLEPPVEEEEGGATRPHWTAKDDADAALHAGSPGMVALQ